jgi:hypothetical protein
VLPFLSLCRVTRPPNEAVKSTKVGAGCFCKSTKAMRGGFCRQRVEVGASRVWRHGPACLGEPRKVLAVELELAAGHDVVVVAVCLVTRWVVAVVGIDSALTRKRLVVAKADFVAVRGRKAEAVAGSPSVTVGGVRVAVGKY